MKKFKTSCGKTVIVNNDIFLVIKNYKWRLSGGNKQYVSRNVVLKNGKQKSLYLHRFVMNAQFGTYVDHINRNPLDNRSCNRLRSG